MTNLHSFYYGEEKVYGFKQRDCYEAVGCFFFGKNTNAVDYAGREIRKGAYNDRNSQYGWNVDHILPVSRGGKTADHNLICCHILTNDEKANSFPLFNANNQKFKIVKKQNHYEILNASDETNNAELKKTNSNNEVNFYDAADGIRLYKKLKGIQNKKGWIGYINTLYISDLVNDNLVDTPKVTEEDRRGSYYKYDYFFTKLSKDLRKESEE